MPNHGQIVDAHVRFHVEAAHHAVHFENNAVTFRRRKNNHPTSEVRVRFNGAQPATFEGINQQQGVANFYRDNSGTTDVPRFAGIRYTNLYPGIDLDYEGQDRKLKRTFTVAPFADPTLIRMTYDGVHDLRLRNDGALIAETALGELTETPPVLYQNIDGTRLPVDGHFTLLDANTVGFEISAYDPAYALVIDPEFDFLTYLGGTGTDHINGIALDEDGNLYATGFTSSTDFLLEDAAQGTFGGVFDSFVTKINPETGEVLYSTYLGGTGNDFSEEIQVDADGNAYIIGTTFSGNFPVQNALQGTNGGGGDTFVVKLNPDGQFIFSTFLGGSLEDSGQGLAFGPEGEVYVTGYTRSANFPTTADAAQPNHAGSYDMYLVEIAPDGSALNYGTYLGGNVDDQAFGIALDAFGDIYLAGSSESEGFITNEVGNKTHITGSAFTIAHIDRNDPDQIREIYGADGGGDDIAYDVATIVANAGSAEENLVIVVTGYSGSTDFPVTPNAPQPTYGGGDADGIFMAFNNTGLIQSTYLGSGGADRLYGVGVRTGRMPDAVEVTTGGEALSPLDIDWIDWENSGSGILVTIPLDVETGDIMEATGLRLGFVGTRLQSNPVSATELTCFGGSTPNPFPANTQPTDNAPQITFPGGVSSAITGCIITTPRPLLASLVLSNPSARIGDLVAIKITVAGSYASAFSLDLSWTSDSDGDGNSGMDEHFRPTDTDRGIYNPPSGITMNGLGLSNRLFNATIKGIPIRSNPHQLHFTASVYCDETTCEEPGLLGSAEATLNTEPRSIDAPAHLVFGSSGGKTALTGIDLYVNDVRFLDDLQAGSGRTLSGEITQTALTLDVVDGDATDNTTPLASFDLDLIYPHPDSVFAFAHSPALVLISDVSSNWRAVLHHTARPTASDPTAVDLVTINLTTDLGPLDVQIIDDTPAHNFVTTLADDVAPDTVSAFATVDPGTYNIEVNTADGSQSLGVFRFDWSTAAGETRTLVALGADTSFTLIAFAADGTIEEPAVVTSTDTETLPTSFVLHGNYPNPFNPVTTLTFDLPARAEVRAEIIDVQGRTVRMLPAQTFQAGVRRTLRVDATGLASGTYFYRLTATMATGTETHTGRMVLIR